MSDFYREELMEHYKFPQNRGVLPAADVTVHEKNPFCGDEIDLQLKIDNGIISGIMFSGDACAVSVASSSIVTEFLKGKSLEEAAALTKEQVLEMLGVELTTSRVKCATLILEALEAALDQIKQDKNGEN